MFYLFPLILPITKGNVIKSLIIGVVIILMGLFFVTNLAPFFTMAAHDVYAQTQDAAVAIPEGFQAGALDFASSPLAWIIFHLTYTFKWVGVSILVLFTMTLMFFNRREIIKYQKEGPQDTNE
jgi:PTS system galactitol-specific IIC component